VSWVRFPPVPLKEKPLMFKHLASHQRLFLWARTSLVALTGCVPPQITTQAPVADIYIDNLIYTTTVTPKQPLIHSHQNVEISISPIDARQFDNLQFSDYIDGRHLDVYVDVSSSTYNRNQYSPTDFSLLEKLDSLGLSLIVSKQILDATLVDDKSSDLVYLFSRTMLTASYNDVVSQNPFSIDNRYLTLFEVQLTNRQNSHSEFCIPTVTAETSREIYHPFSKAVILNHIDYMSVAYEYYDKLLMPECLLLPPNSIIKRLLAFPSLNYNESFFMTYHVQGGPVRAEIEVDVNVENSRATLVPVNLKIPSSTNQTLRSTPGGLSTNTYGVQTFSMNTITHWLFIVTPTRLIPVSGELMYIQEDMDLTGHYFISIQKAATEYTVKRVPLQRSDINRRLVELY
jgi:hypothetical protein